MVNINKTIKAILAILLISTPVLSQVSLDEATDEAVKFKEPAEGINLEPKHKVNVGNTEYWPFEITDLGKIQFIVPINAETGEVADNTTWTPIMETHYLANFFKTTDSIKGYLDSAQSFGEGKESTFSSAKEELESFYEPQINITLNNMDPLQNKLGEAADAAKTLQSDSIDTSSQIENLNTPSDVTKAEQNIKSVINQQRSLINIGEEVNSRANDLEQEVVAARDEGEIDSGVATSILSITDGVKSDYIQVRNNLQGSENTLNSFLDSLDSKIEDFKTKLQKRMEIPEEQKTRNQILEQLDNYQTKVNKLVNNSQDLPYSYLQGEGFQDTSESTLNMIQDSISDCQTDNISKCKEAIDQYQEIESSIQEMNQTIQDYEPCTEGETKECTVNGQQGIQQCQNGQWTTCTPTDTGGVNWGLVGGLTIILAVLILYKFKDKIFQGGEDHEQKKKQGPENLWS